LREGLRDARFDISLNREKALYALAVVLAPGLIGLAWLFTTAARKPPEQRLLAGFLKRMKKRGYAKSRSQGLEEFAAMVKEDDLRENARRFVDRFERIYYHDRRPTTEQVRGLKRIIRQL
jgi:hypothetical protein